MNQHLLPPFLVIISASVLSCPYQSVCAARIGTMSIDYSNLLQSRNTPFVTHCWLVIIPKHTIESYKAFFSMHGDGILGGTPFLSLGKCRIYCVDCIYWSVTRRSSWP